MANLNLPDTLVAQLPIGEVESYLELHPDDKRLQERLEQLEDLEENPPEWANDDLADGEYDEDQLEITNV